MNPGVGATVEEGMWTRLILRIVTAAGVLISAAVHYKLWHEGFRELHVVGPAFLLNAIGGLLIGVLLLVWWHWVPPLLAVGFGLSTLGAFVMSATVGFYGVHELWTGPDVTRAWVAEVVAVLGGLTLVLLARPWRSLRRAGRRTQVASRSTG